ncbi:MAG: YihY/virulence factor BrkB family protein [Thermomicrobiales bacterium]|jgi:membrane protein|nr:YihY/virulence factor BrkB family protein [Thermomicrobiales bacterium]
MTEPVNTLTKIRSTLPVRFVTDIIEIVINRNLNGYAQMVAYHLLFATAPLLIVITAGAGAITRAVNDDLENPALPVLNWMQENFPAEVADFLRGPIESAINQQANWAFSIGSILALWGARGAIAAIMRGLNVAYGIEKEPRNFIVTNLIATALAILLVVLVATSGIVYTLSTSFGADLAERLGFLDSFNRFAAIATYPFMLLIAVGAFVVLNRYGPAWRGPVRAYIPGAIFTVLGLYISTFALSFWFSISGGFSEAYGVFGSVLVFIFFLYVMALIVLLGGAINATWHRFAQAQHD